MKKTIMIMAMLVGTGLLFGAQMIIAESGRPSSQNTNAELDPWEDCNFIIDITARCFNIIIHQNNEIIEKLDWGNCVAKHKEARDYKPPNDDSGIIDSQDYNDLEKHCGEMP